MAWIITGFLLVGSAALLLLAGWPIRTRLPAPAHHDCSLPPPSPDLRLVRLSGAGDYGLEVFGGSACREALGRLCGPPCETGHRRKAIAILVPEHRGDAVAVMIDGERVGYLSPDAVEEHLDEMKRRGWPGLPAMCDAVIVDGRERVAWGQVDRGDFRVKLDVSRPLAGEVHCYRAAPWPSPTADVSPGPTADVSHCRLSGEFQLRHAS